MAERVRPYRLESNAPVHRWAAATYGALESAREAAGKLPSGTRWKIKKQATRYGKRELIEEGVTP